MRRLLLIAFAIFFTQLAYSQVVVNEFCVANYTDYAISGENEDWIEFFNPTGAPIDIGGYWLSDNISNPQKFAIPAGTSIPANGYRIILLSGTFDYNPGYLGQINTNFKVTQTAGEQIVFSNPAGVVLESFDFSTLSPNQANHSYGRSTDGAANFVIFLDPTPNASNGGTTGIAYAARPQFSLEAGYYATGTTVSISTSEPGATIYYTTDGSFPTNASTLYTGPVTIDVTKVIRAIAYSPDASILPSFIETNTFFTGADQHTIVIASVSGPTLSDGSWFGDEAMHLEIFDAAGNFVVEASGDSNEHGNDSNAYAQRGFDYVTRDAMGYDNEVESNIINTRDRDGYERLIFKAAANDNYPFSNGGAHIRDAYVCQLSILGGLKLDERSTESCVVYINGQFWGVYEIREKVDDIDFTDHYYDQPEGFVDFLKTWGGTWTEYGNGSDWYDLVNFITTNDMTVQANYDYVLTQYNTISLIDYFILNGYVVCTDWLNWNTAWWRGRHPDGDAKRWRYALWDNDATFGHYINYTGVDNTTPDADPCQIDDEGDIGGQGHIPVLNALFDNEQFFADYIQRYATLSNSIFSCEMMNHVLDSMVNVIEPEMTRHCQRWGGTYATWQNNVQAIRDFIDARCNSEIIGGLEDCYDVTALTLTVQIDGVGTIEIEDIDLNEGIVPWSGTYFADLPIDINIPGEPCGTFAGWEIISGDGVLDNPSAPETFLTMTTDVTLVAHFVAGTGVASVSFDMTPAGAGVLTVNGAEQATVPVDFDFNLGEAQTVSVTENEWFEFDHWESGSDLSPNEESLEVTFTSCLTETMTAVFNEIPHAEITIDVFPAGAGTINMNGTPLASYPYNDVLLADNYSLDAIEITDVTVFDHWELNNNVISPDEFDPNIILTLENDDVLIAHFIVLNRVDLTMDVSPAGAGTITKDGVALVTYPQTENLLTDVVYSFSTSPIDQWSTFDHWELNHNTLTPDQLTPDVTMNLQEEDTLIAVYIVVPHYPITVMVEPAYSGTVQFENGYVTSDEMTVVMEGAVQAPFIAGAEENFTFKNWEYRYSTIQGDVETPIVNFTFNAPDTIIAHFDKDPLLYYVPNSFSPNGDGINDVFRPVTHAGDPEYYHMMVFNRWGDKVFDSTDPDEYWTGEYRNGEYYVSDNVYMYQLEVKWVHAEQYVKKTGTIMVFR